MSDSDFFQFVEENADLFADEEFFEDFMNGADLTKYTLEQQEAFNDYKKQLMAVDAQIAVLSKSNKKEEDKEKLKSLEIERRTYLLSQLIQVL